MADIVSVETNADFESIMHVRESGETYWLARELFPLLGYSTWQNFQPVLAKAIQACDASGFSRSDQFKDVHKLVDIGSGAVREKKDYELTRYACYLIIQNGDPSKPAIASGQTYFAVQTHRQELHDAGISAQAMEDEKRLLIREQMKDHNKHLAAAAKDAGVSEPKDYARFQDRGYQGLYGGLGSKQIHARKGLAEKEKILDHMGSTELAANLFRATQTEERLRRDAVHDKHEAGNVHFDVGQKVRKAIADIGGTMPENLPTPDKSINQLKLERKKAEKALSRA